MRAYLISLAVGVLAGSIYGLLNVRSPAPPVIALIGLLGMLLGEQLVPLGKRFVQGRPVASIIKTKCAPEILGARADPCRKADKA